MHATYACEEDIKSFIQNYYKEKLCEVKKQIEKKIAIQGTSCEEEKKEKANLEYALKKDKISIKIEYISCPIDIARVIKVNKSFTICLSKELSNKLNKQNGDFDYDIIKKIRNLMSHELGHLILHTNDLLDINSTQGSKEISDSSKEEEATFFGEQLLEYRRERNKILFEAGGAHTLF